MEKEKKKKTGRPLTYKTAKELEEKIEQYFESCKGEVLKDKKGDIIFTKYGDPIILNAKPPTITGLALFLGLASRQALLNYQGRKQFNDTITRAKSRVEEFAESKLYDRNGCSGAKFNLINNFKGWSEKPQNDDDSNKESMNQALINIANLLLKPSENRSLPTEKDE